MTLSVVDLLKIGIVSDALDPLLRRDNLVIAGHYRDTLELQPLCEVHCTDGDAAALRLGGFVESRGASSGDLVAITACSSGELVLNDRLRRHDVHHCLAARVKMPAMKSVVCCPLAFA